MIIMVKKIIKKNKNRLHSDCSCVKIVLSEDNRQKGALMEKLSIKAIRVNLGMTQEEFCKMIDMPISTYRLKEQGKSDWTYKEVIAISKIAKVPLSKISEV